MIRVPYAGGIGGVEHHSDSSEAYYAHTPGLKVVTPATVADAYSLTARGHRRPRPGGVPRTEEAVLVQGRSVVAGGPADPVRPSGRAPSGHRMSPCWRTGRACRWLSPPPRRPLGTVRAVEVVDLRTINPVRRRDRRRLGAQDRAHVSSSPSPPGSPGSAPRWSPGFRNVASTPWPHRCCGSPVSTSRIRRRNSNTITCPVWTGCSTPSTGCSGTTHPWVASWTVLSALPRPGGRSHRGRDPGMAGRRRRPGRGRPDRGRGRNRQGRGGRAVSVPGHGRGPAR